MNRLAVWLIVLSGAGTLPSLHAASCPPGANLIDRDGNGLMDYACVGDWNRSGACEMEQDIRAAIAALNDAGPKRVELSDCSFAPPLLAAGENGIVELPSNLTLAGQGPATVLNGFSEFDKTSRQAVVSNSSFVTGNSNITVRDLAIDGGWRDQDTQDVGTHHRMGVFFDNCDNCLVEDVTVTDTLHSCLYARNSTGVRFLNSTLRRCGNSEGTGPSTFSCVYLYAHRNKVLEDALVMGIDCDGSGYSALNTRRETATATLRNLVFRNNVVRNTKVENGVAKHCIMIRGVESALFENTTCIDTGGLTTGSASSYYSEGTDAEASANVTVDGLTLVDSHRTGLLIQGYFEGFTGRNISVDNTPDHHCLQFIGPQRGFLLEDSQLSNCGLRGVSEFGATGNGSADDEAMVFRRVRIDGVGLGKPGLSGLYILGPTRALTLDGIEVAGGTGHGVELDGPAEQLVVRDSTFSDNPASGILLRNGCHDCTFDGNHVSGAGGDGLALLNTGGPNPGQAGVTIRDNVFTDIGARAIAFAPGSVVENVSVRRNDVDGTGGDGIDLELATADLSTSVEVQGNSVRDFGRAGIARGIDVRGAVVGLSVAGNLLEAPPGQAEAGIAHDVPGGDPSYLCFNTCGGALTIADCLKVPGDASYSSDLDTDGVPDACTSPCPEGTDPDNDGYCSVFDNCAGLANPTQEDVDGDGVGDVCDVCPFVHDPDQEDADGDGRGDACPANPSLLQNGDFDSGLLSPWIWFSNSEGSATVADDQAEVELQTVLASGANIQLYQKNVPVVGGWTYRVALDAECSNTGGPCGAAPTGPDVTLFLHEHEPPNTNYGLAWNQTLAPFMRTFAAEFTAPARLPPIKNGRLRIWFSQHGEPGNVYRFDRLSLRKTSVCGDQFVDIGEQCDDGNAFDGDDCLANCTIATCGDGVLRLGIEECDDGNLGGGDGCESDCTLSCRDADGDGHGLPGNSFCAAGAEGDCDDADVSVYPGAAELCDDINNDCNEPGWPAAPAGDRDADGDGIKGCEGDCNDLDAAVHPSAAESCNGIDDDCNGLIDDDLAGEDSDADGVLNLCDNCSDVANADQQDSDRDRAGDVCDNCPSVPNPYQSDSDLDELGDACDGCPEAFDPLQEDGDLDLVGDACDNCPLLRNLGQADVDDDAQGNACDVNDGLIFISSVDGIVMWQVETGFDTWNVYRGDLDILRETGSYTQAPLSNSLAGRECGLTEPRADDQLVPDSGKIAFYLVSGVTLGIESDLGADGAGAPRPNTAPCP